MDDFVRLPNHSTVNWFRNRIRRPSYIPRLGYIAVYGDGTSGFGNRIRRRKQSLLCKRASMLRESYLRVQILRTYQCIHYLQYPSLHTSYPEFRSSLFSYMNGDTTTQKHERRQKIVQFRHWRRHSWSIKCLWNGRWETYHSFTPYWYNTCDIFIFVVCRSVWITQGKLYSSCSCYHVR